MSKLEELIQELCPNGVEYKEIKKFANVSIGEFVHKNKQSPDAPYPVFNGGTSNTGFYYNYNRTANKIIISARGANAGFVNRVFTNFWSGNSCYTIEVDDESVNWNYLYYWLKSKESKLLGEQQKGGIPAVSKKQVEEFLTPIPPLPVQQEIVRILDNFTELTAELTVELTARKKQYEYYRDEVFRVAFSSGRTALLGEVASFSQGIQIDPSNQYNEMQPGRIRFLRIVDFVTDNEPYRYIEEPDKKYVKTENDLIMIRYGASAAGRVFMCHAGAIANNMFKINPHSDILPRYLLHYLSQNAIYTMLNSVGGKSTMPAVNFKTVSKIAIPLVSLSEQKKIIDTLDRFDALCNDLTSGLPAEIEARQKQYEYYREKLLTFKELEV